MSTPPDDAQRNMEQKALRNVRALVDKLERKPEEQMGPGRFVLWFVLILAILFGLVTAAAILHMMVKGPPPAPREIHTPEVISPRR